MRYQRLPILLSDEMLEVSRLMDISSQGYTKVEMAYRTGSSAVAEATSHATLENGLLGA